MANKRVNQRTTCSTYQENTNIPRNKDQCNQEHNLEVKCIEHTCLYLESLGITENQEKKRMHLQETQGL